MPREEDAVFIAHINQSLGLTVYEGNSEAWPHFRNSTRAPNKVYCWLCTLKLNASRSRLAVVQYNPVLPHADAGCFGSATSTTTLIKHMRSAHNVGQPAEDVAAKRQRQFLEVVLPKMSTDEKTSADKLLFDVIISENIPFIIVRRKAFRKFLRKLNPGYTPASVETLHQLLSDRKDIISLKVPLFPFT